MKRAFTLLELAIVVAMIAIIAAFMWPVLVPHRTPRTWNCQSNLKQIGMGVMQYSIDYNGFLPVVSTGTSGAWSEAVYPYLKNRAIFQCISLPNQTTPTIDYFFNARLSYIYLPKLQSPTRTICVGDGQEGAPTWTNLSQLPSQWLTDERSPAWRHGGTGNYLFADGHVKTLMPSRISTVSPKTATATFAIR